VQTGSGLHFYYREVHELFDELIDKPWGAACWHPPADVRETDDAFLIEMDVSGISAEDVHIVARDRMVFVEGERNLYRAEAGGVVHVCERAEGRFARTFCFDDPIETDGIEHSVADGVLVVAVPKPRNRQEETDE
jgi:HSP20 family protein